jgi:hypothetical protein
MRQRQNLHPQSAVVAAAIHRASVGFFITDDPTVPP